MINPKILKKLLKDLIIQNPYPGDVCLSDETIIAFIEGETTLEENKNIKKHLKSCDQCAQHVAELKKLSKSYNKIYGGFKKKINENGQKHISDKMLKEYFRGNIPANDRGGVLINKIKSHLKTCDICRKRYEYLYRAEDSLDVINLAYTRKPEGYLKRIGAFFAELSEFTGQIYTGRQYAVQALYRGEDDEPVYAQIIDSSNQIVIGQDGTPRTIRFGYIRGELDRHGYCTLDLIASRDQLPELDSEEYYATVSLQFKNTRIDMPEEKIGMDGRLTITYPLGLKDNQLTIPAKILLIKLRPA